MKKIVLVGCLLFSFGKSNPVDLGVPGLMLAVGMGGTAMVIDTYLHMSYENQLYDLESFFNDGDKIWNHFKDYKDLTDAELKEKIKKYEQEKRLAFIDLCDDAFYELICAVHDTLGARFDIEIKFGIGTHAVNTVQLDSQHYASLALTPFLIPKTKALLEKYYTIYYRLKSFMNYLLINKLLEETAS